MAAKRKAAKRNKPPETVVGTLTKAGKPKISNTKLQSFLKKLKKKKKSPKVRFVARNAPFMRESPVATV